MVKPVIDDLKKLIPGDNDNSKIVKSVVPINMSIMVPTAKDGTYSIISRITWLCKNYSNELFCLTSTYIAETDEDEEFLVGNPLYEERYFSNYKLTADLLMSSLPHYLTNMNFTFDSEDFNNAQDFNIYLQAEYIDEENSSNDKLIKIMVSPEVFSTLCSVDNYMLSGVTNNGDLDHAFKLGSDESNNTKFCKVDSIDIEDYAPTTTKRTCSSLALKLKVTRSSKHTSVDYKLILPLFVGKYKNKIFKKKKMDSLLKGYLSHNSEFISMYTFSYKINDNDYIFIRAINNANDGYIFVFDEKDIEKIIDSIE